MEVVTMRQAAPVLRRPALVAAFSGWNDAGEAASGAVNSLRRGLRGRTFASIDPEEFYDFQVNRPMIREAPSGGRRLDWPRNRFSWAQLPDAGRDLVLFEGTEPNLRWRTYSEGVIRLVRELGVELVVTLGALQVDTPHTRPVPITGSSTSPELAERVALRRSSYEGPTGITGVLTQRCGEEGLAVASLWAGVPHYLAGARYLTGALALTTQLGRLLGATLPLERLQRDAEEQNDEIASLVSEDEDLAEYVTELESRTDDLDVLPPAPVDGDELVAELERYLRDRRGE